MNIQAIPSSANRSAELALLVEKLSARLEAGEPVDREEVERQYPQFAAELCELLPAMALLVNLSRSGERRGVSPTCDDGTPLGELGDYRIVREVGRGGMGIVYEAEQISLGRRVALKMLPYAATMDPKHLQRFKNEAKAAASLRHEHIVHVYGVGCERGVHYYAMEFIDGQTLAQFIAGMYAPSPSADILSPSPLAGEGRGGGYECQSLARPTPHPNPPPQGGRGPEGDATSPYVPAAHDAPTAPVAALSTERSGPKGREFYRTAAALIADAADALEHAHGLGIVHRDVKPGNLLVDAAGKLYVSDFGLARIGPDTGLTVSGDLLGTLRYMAPEQALARHGLVDHRVDVYGLGATLYELFTGKPAVGGEHKADILKAIAFEDPTAPRKLDRSIPMEFETITLKALAKDPQGRYATAQELADDLRYWLDDEPIRAKRPGLWQRLARWVRRHKYLVCSAVAMMGVAVVALTVSTVLLAQKEKVAQDARQRADERFHFAREVVNEMYSNVTEKLLEYEPDLEETQERFLLKALAFYEKLAAEFASDDALRRERGIAFTRVGTIFFKLGQTDNAMTALGQAVELLNELAHEVPARPEYRSDLALAHHAIGVTLTNTERTSEGLTHAGMAVSLREQLVADFPSERSYRRDLALSLNAYSVFLQKDRRVRDAEAVARKAISEYESVLEEKPTPLEQSALAGKLHNLAGLVYGDGRSTEARELLERAIGLQRLALEMLPRSRSVLTALGNHYELCGPVLWQLQCRAEAEEAIRQGVIVRQRLVENFPRTVQYRYAFVSSQRQLAVVLLLNGHSEESESVIRQAIENSKLVLRLSPRPLPQYRYALGTAYMTLGTRLMKDKSKLSEADEALGQAAEVLRQLVLAFPNNAAYHSQLGAALNDQGIVANKQGNTGDAIRLLTEAIEHQRIALQASPRYPTYRQCLRNHYTNLANYLTLGAELQFRDSRRAIELAKNAIDLDGKFGGAYSAFGFAKYRAGSMFEAVNSFEKALSLFPRDSENEDRAKVCLGLAMTYHQFGDLYLPGLYFAAAQQLMDGVTKDESYHRIVAEAVELIGIKPAAKAERQGPPDGS